MPPNKKEKGILLLSNRQSACHCQPSYGKLLFSNLYSAGNLLRVQLAKPKFLYSCSFVVLLLFMRNHFQVNPLPLHNFVPMVLTFNIPVFQYMLVMFRYRFLLRHCVHVVVVLSSYRFAVRQIIPVLVVV